MSAEILVCGIEYSSPVIFKGNWTAIDYWAQWA